MATSPVVGLRVPVHLVGDRPRSLRLTPAAALLVAAAFTSSWTAVAVGGTKLVDLLLLGAFVLLLPRLFVTRYLPPAWLLVGAIGLVMTMVIHHLMPVDESYLATRYVLELRDVDAQRIATESSLFVGVHWMVGLAALPWMAWSESWRSPRLGVWMAAAFVSGAAVSAGVAVVGFLGLADIAGQLLGYSPIDRRQPGLTDHPNNLGVVCVMALPVAAYLLRFRRLAAAMLIVLLGAGVLLSGSRGAQAGAGFALAVLTVARPELRRRIPTMAAALVATLAMCIAVAPRSLDPLRSLVRFSSEAAADSDVARSMSLEQAKSDILRDPIAGVGLRVVLDAHNIYLQLLAAGGVVLLVTVGVYCCGVLRAGWRARAHTPLAANVTLALVVWLVMGIFQNQLTERYLYVLVAAVAAMSAAGLSQRVAGMSRMRASS
ncbi:MAG: O-antigen ligase family protein [Propionibacteriales bacterium]|nr:O-antigen ligase family protein [Propionibacteriales bacterium]